MQQPWRGYPRQFWLIMAGMLFSTIGTSMVRPFLTIYVSEQLGISLTEVTALIAINGLVSLGASFLAGPAADRVGRKWLMVVLFQVSVTRVTKRYAPLRVMFVGAMIYALGVSSIAFGYGFWTFWLSYVVVTVGELIIAPTAVGYVADCAPVEQRGRYMSVFSLAQGTAGTVSPVIGGQLNDRNAPQAIWIGGGLLGLAGATGFWLLDKRERRQAAVVNI